MKKALILATTLALSAGVALALSAPVVFSASTPAVTVSSSKSAPLLAVNCPECLDAVPAPDPKEPEPCLDTCADVPPTPPEPLAVNCPECLDRTVIKPRPLGRPPLSL
ncbi:hypothetical protein [Deinococcus sp. PEB2-67]